MTAQATASTNSPVTVGPDVQTFDVIVIGSGAAGLLTAIVTARSGLRTLVLEKTRWVGGTTALSGGGVWLPCHPKLASLGQQDSIDAVLKYLSSISPIELDLDGLGAFLADGPEVLRYLETHTSVRLRAIRLPDYYSNAPGAVSGRSLLTLPFDGARLGLWLYRLKKPLKAFTVLGGMQIDQMDMPRFLNAWRNRKDFLYAARSAVRFFGDILLHGRGRYLANGNALAGSLLHSALQSDVTVQTSSQVIDLVRVGDRVSGVVVARAGQTINMHARHSVVLATGGFGANADLVRRHMAMPDAHLALAAEGNQGDGLSLGTAAGGVLATDTVFNGLFAPMSALRNRQGYPTMLFPHFGVDRAKPGALIVNASAVRFTNEAKPYHDLVQDMVNGGVDKAWLIADSTFIDRYGLGLVRPSPFPRGRYQRRGYLIKADSIADLAQKLGLPPSILESTITDFNTHARSGEDKVFSRGATSHDRSYGDRIVRPNPNLAPLVTPPYYAVALYPGSVGTTLGLRTSLDGEVLDQSGAPVHGLYATGLDRQSIFRGLYPSGGASLGPAMISSFRVGRRIVQTSGRPLR